MEILYSFIGCLLAILLHDLIGLIPNRVKQVEEMSPKKRQIPTNIGRFSDPLGEYEHYKDDKTHLYKTYVPEKSSRRGEE